MSLRALAALAMLICSAATGPSFAQDSYPTRPIKLVVGLSPGGGADTIARVMAARASGILGQEIVVENLPGAGGNIAAQSVAESGADGYTLLETTVAQAMAPALYDNLQYDYLKDFDAVAGFASAGFVLVATNDLPVGSVEELIAYAKAHPGELNYGSSGAGGPSHLAGEMLKSLAGIDMQHIPFKGMSEVLTDVIAGRVQVAFAALPSALPMIAAGKLKGLAISSSERSALAPDLPTVAEAGVPGFEATTWFGALAPAGTPEPVLKALSDAFLTSAEDAEVRKKVTDLGFDPLPMSSEAFSAYVRAETEKWGKLIRDTGVTLE
jgi:tripartite-type tricarboxylate transporter receptor subunit TctC